MRRATTTAVARETGRRCLPTAAGKKMSGDPMLPAVFPSRRRWSLASFLLSYIDEFLLSCRNVLDKTLMSWFLINVTWLLFHWAGPPRVLSDFLLDALELQKVCFFKVDYSRFLGASSSQHCLLSTADWLRCMGSDAMTAVVDVAKWHLTNTSEYQQVKTLTKASGLHI